MQDPKNIDWDGIEAAMVREWYFVSKIMGKEITPNYPYFTFHGIVEEIKEDPNFKKGDET